MCYIVFVGGKYLQKAKNTMNTFELRQQDKRERYALLAEKNAAKSTELWESAHKSLSFIPFGQPILVGHYSERPMRNHIEREHNKIRKSIELDEKAKYYVKKSEEYGTNCISSDDPDALNKLRDKLSALILAHTIMKDENKKAKKNGESLPYATYQLTNSNARIKSTEKRIKEIEQKDLDTETRSASGDGWEMTEDKDDNRILFTFNGKPSDERRKLLKGRGFKWSPTRNAWVRQINNAGRYAAKIIIQSL